MKILSCSLLVLLISLQLPAQESFEDQIARIKELPLEEQLVRFQEAANAGGHPPLQQARYHHELGVVHFIQDDLFQAIEQTERALALRLEHEQEAGEEVVFSAYNLGSFYYNIGYFDQAFARFQLIVDRAPNARLGYTLFRLGSLYRDIGEFELSKRAFEEAIRQAPFPDDRAERTTLIIEWADLYLKQATPEAARLAIPLLKTAYSAYDELAASDDYYASLAALSLNRLGLAHYHEQDAAAAIGAFRRALAYNDACCQEADLTATIYTNMGLAYSQMKQPKKALSFHQEALKIREPSAKQGTTNMALALVYDNLATASAPLKEYETGIEQIQTALRWALPQFSPREPTDNPPLSLLKTSPNKNSILIYLQDKGDLWQQRALAEDQGAYLDQAIATFQVCDQLIDLIREDHLEKNSKLYWREQARKMYRSAVEATWIADRPDLAFYFSEKSRAVLLLDGLQEINAHSRLPAKTQAELARLKAQIQYLEKVAYEQGGKGTDPGNSRLPVLQQQYRYLLDSIETQYPDYYQQKYRPDFVDLAEVQGHLNTDETWVEYFMADDFNLALVITPDGINMVELASTSELSPHINRLLTTLKKYDAPFDPKPALALYQYLIEPLRLPPGTKLTIVPDGQLSLIPFEVLLREPPAGEDYNQWTFLLQDHQLAYAFSANTQLFQPQEKQLSNGRILAFAPMALLEPDYGVDAALELPETRYTAEFIAGILPTDIYLGRDARRQTLETTAPQAAVLHLATHAYLNHEQPEFSYFLMAEPRAADRRFYVSELYQYQFQADLAVLSACETGGGKLLRGEGVASIGRAFAQNGCPNLAMSLWPVDEGATGRLLELFYKNLETGIPKAEALYQAKKDYLQQANSSKGKHPFRWAGFVYYGEDQPLELSASGGNKLWYLLAVGGMGLLGLSLMQRRKG